jgi:ferric iron reductase protein FhuF
VGVAHRYLWSIFSSWGFALLITLPLVIVYFTQVERLNTEVGNAAAERAVTQLAEAADTVYFLGAPSVRTVSIDLPENVQSITISEQSIVLRIDSAAGIYERVAFTAGNVTGNIGITAGPHTLLVEATESDIVNITEQ